MNIKCLYALVFALMISIAINASETMHSYLNNNIQIVPLNLTYIGDSIFVELDIDINAKSLKCNGSVDIIPYLYSGDNVKELPAVLLKTRKTRKVYNRQVALASSKNTIANPYIVATLTKSPIAINYKKSLVYEGWMKDAQLGIYIDDCGCRSKERQEALLIDELNDENVIYVPNFMISYVSPTVEEVKIRDIELNTYLDFVVNKTDILPEYRNNTIELRKVANLIAEIQNDKDVSVRAISISGFASPEGSIANNKRLSEGRALSLANIISVMFQHPKEMYSIQYGGENWRGLAEYVEASQLAHKNEILQIVNRYNANLSDDEVMKIKQALKNLDGGKPYKTLLADVFPSLRKAVCKVDFEVKNFSLEEAKEVFKTRPQNLSLNELFIVANSYEQGSDEYNEVFEMAVRLYPTDATANLNAAIAALSREDLIRAERYLKSVDEALYPDVYYKIMGAIESKKGNNEAALDYFGKANDTEAQHNINEINKIKR